MRPIIKTDSLLAGSRGNNDQFKNQSFAFFCLTQSFISRRVACMSHERAGRAPPPPPPLVHSQPLIFYYWG